MNQSKEEASLRLVHQVLDLPPPSLASSLPSVCVEAKQTQEVSNLEEEKQNFFFLDSLSELPPPFSKTEVPSALHKKGMEVATAGSIKSWQVKPLFSVKEFSIITEIEAVGDFLKRGQTETSGPNIYGSQHYIDLLKTNL